MVCNVLYESACVLLVSCLCHLQLYYYSPYVFKLYCFLWPASMFPKISVLFWFAKLFQRNYSRTSTSRSVLKFRRGGPCASLKFLPSRSSRWRRWSSFCVADHAFCSLLDLSASSELSRGRAFSKDSANAFIFVLREGVEGFLRTCFAGSFFPGSSLVSSTPLVSSCLRL